MVFRSSLKGGLITEEFAHPAHQIEPGGHRRQQHVAVLIAEQPAGWSHAVDQGCLRPSQQGHGCCQVGHDGDSVGDAIEHESCVEACTLAVDHSADAVPIAGPHQTVGRLAIESGEVTFAVNNCWCCAD